MSVEVQPRCGHPSTSRMDKKVGKVCQACLTDHCRTICEISEITSVSWSSCQRILTADFTMKRVTAEWVPCLLKEKQNSKRVNVCSDLQKLLKNDPQFLTEVVTGDDCWCDGNNPESKLQSNQWKSPNSPRPKKVWQVHLCIKPVLISCFGIGGLVHREFVAPG